jgi:hypothetical protein
MLVTIRNKKTGETKQVEQDQLGTFGLGSTPTNTSSPTSQTPTSNVSNTNASLDALNKAAQADLASTGGKNIAKIKTLMDVFIAKQNAEKAGQPTSDEIKLQEEKKTAENSKQQALSVVDELLSRDTGAITGIKNPIKYLTGEAKYTKNLSDQLISMLSLENRQKLKGSGAISDFEAQTLEKSASALRTNLNNEDFANELLKIKGILSGQKIEKPAQKGQVQKFLEGKALPIAGATIGGVAGSLLGGAPGIVGAGAGYAGGDIVRKGLLDLTGGRQMTAQDRGRDVLDTSAGAATSMAAEAVGLGVGKLVGKGVGAAKSAFAPKEPIITESSLLKGLVQAEKGKAVRETAIKTAETAGKKVDGTKVFSSIKKELTSAKATATPQEAKQIDELIKSANKYWNGKQINPTTAKIRWDKAASAFKDSGKRGDTVKSVYDGAIRDGIRKQLDQITKGGFEKGTSQIAKGLQTEKLLKGIRNTRDRKLIKDAMVAQPSKAADLLKTFVKRTGGVAAGSVSTALAFKILGLGGRSQGSE